MEKVLKYGFIKQKFFDGVCIVQFKTNSFNIENNKKILYSNIKSIELIKGGMFKNAQFNIEILNNAGELSRGYVQFENKYYKDALIILEFIEKYPKASIEQAHSHSDPIQKNVTKTISKPIMNKTPVSKSIGNTKTASFRVAGISFHTDALMAIASENVDYSSSNKELIDQYDTDEKIYEYEFYVTHVKLVEEPENKYDNNAVAVYVEGHKIGYIKKGSTAQVKNLLNSGLIKEIECDISGGNYKKVYYDDDREKYYVEKHTKGESFYAKITIESYIK